MMLTLEPIVGKQIASTCAGLARESYWLHRITCPGRWRGNGAGALGLVRSVRPNALRAVLQGLTPDGKVRLADNAREPTRMGGWLFDFKSPLTLNALHAVAPAAFARQTEIAHEHAVKTTLDELEKSVKEREGVSMAFALFQHQVGHGQTPALHTLVAVPNLGFLESGRVQEIKVDSIRHRRKDLEMLYVMTYANRLEQICLQLKMDGDGFRIAGVPMDAARLLAREFGLNRGRGFELYHAWRKAPTYYQSELQERWNALGEKAGWTSEQATDLVNYTRTHHTKTAEFKAAESTTNQSQNHQGHSH